MTTFDYARAQATAERLLARFGQRGAILRQGKTPDSPKWNPTPAEPDSYPATLAVLDYENRHIDGSRILATDKRVYVSVIGLAIEPTTSDRVADAGGTAYKIVSVKPFAPAGTVVFYEIQARA